MVTVFYRGKKIARWDWYNFNTMIDIVNDHQKKIGKLGFYVDREVLEQDIMGFTYKEVRQQINRLGYTFDYKIWSFEELQNIVNNYTLEKLQGLYEKMQLRGYLANNFKYYETKDIKESQRIAHNKKACMLNWLYNNQKYEKVGKLIKEL